MRDRIRRLFFGAQTTARFYALRDISFTVDHGESVAIIGPNGAGKSTLLNLATGLCRPDQGRVATFGRIAPLLELGAGFHPDLTGAENVRINSSLMGLSRREMRVKFDEIVAFSEVGDFINEPLRTYSTGMAMRLAFSVAVCVDPDLLIIDEVLGVGDLAFSAKCLARIMEFRQMGKTILCVSHSIATVLELCNRAIWLDHGRMVDSGPVNRVMQAYKDATIGKVVQSIG
jgi:ABC-type polysaccharide/polyol phosphate transport system ATPase subunit